MWKQELSHDKRDEFLDIEKEKMEQWGDILPFYKNMQKEGIVLWKTA